eukprot:scaffold620_cov169-Amphora_coffeaeformis.AAC.21
MCSAFPVAEPYKMNNGVVVVVVVSEDMVENKRRREGNVDVVVERFVGRRKPLPFSCIFVFGMHDAGLEEEREAREWDDVIRCGMWEFYDSFMKCG